MADGPNINFSVQLHSIREGYSKKRDSTNLFSPTGRELINTRKEFMGTTLYSIFWYGNGTDARQYVRLADVAGTLSGEILRLNRELPERDDDYEIVGDQIRPLKQAPPPPPEEPDDSEDLGQILERLPVVQVDDGKHFTKQSRYKSEVRNLLKCQGESCPGSPASEHIIQLLGKSPAGKLVFEKFKPRYLVLGQVHALSTYLAWVLQLISGLKSLHLLDIVHRDLRIDNLVFSDDYSKIIIIDMESHWGIRQAPELSRDPNVDPGWTEKSDIYDLGNVIRHMVLGNAPITDQVEIPVVSPLDRIVEACTSPSPEKRPSLEELHQMVSEITG
ncbi:Mitogen-activated protein kinase kinase kinase mom-4 [Colletotrichum shisoi]|uniref:EKC/KEOPS complex subunit BUD32 n=1 Tax=Colletotrichum shisoi TaxID=2078593 RepID=A0A5Q4BEE7_9PEZI|nr:Mitogen-activated protein kinase kinase kinase mom-4 [Colletotrichum shisoi]